MAYLSDPRHAASVLIYYIVITFVEFGLLEFTFRSTWFGKGQSESIPPASNRERCKCTYTCAFGVAILFSVLIHALTVTATIFFYLIPVSESIGRAPSQIVVTYQTAFILVGGYIIYQVIIKKQNSLQRALREYKCEWKSLPDHELLTEFYKDTIAKTDRYIQHVIGDTTHDQPRQADNAEERRGNVEQ
jgi:amino acid permease